MDPTANNGLAGAAGFLQGIAGGVGENMKFEHERRLEEIAALRAQRQMRGYGQTVPGSYAAQKLPGWDPNEDAPLGLVTGGMRDQIDAQKNAAMMTFRQQLLQPHGKNDTYNEGTALATVDTALKNAGLSFADPDGAKLAESMMNEQRQQFGLAPKAYTSALPSGGLFGGTQSVWTGGTPDYSAPSPKAPAAPKAPATAAPALPDDTNNGAPGTGDPNGAWSITPH
jgi:hypothetical protein